MGMDSFLVRVPKKYATSGHILIADSPFDDLDGHMVGYWRKCWGLNQIFMTALAGDTISDRDAYLHRLDKKQCKRLIECFKDIDSLIYTDTIWNTDMKSRKRYRKEYLKTMKKVLKKIKDGKQIYYGCSY